MFAIQCLIISLFCGLYGYGWSLYGPVLPVYILTKPLFGGLVCGVVFGDLHLGLELGCAIQLGYLVSMSVGGTYTTDQGFLAYPTIALAMVNHLEAGAAIAIGATVGSFVSSYYAPLQKAYNVISAKICDDAIEKNDYKKFVLGMRVVPLGIQILVRVIPSFLMVYFGSQVVEQVIAVLPQKVLYGLGLFSKWFPAVGIAVLLSTTVKHNWYFIFFGIGFVLNACLKLPVIGSSVIAAGIAYLYYLIESKEVTALATASVSDDEEVL